MESIQITRTVDRKRRPDLGRFPETALLLRGVHNVIHTFTERRR